jgi:hypothetical protein
MSGRSAPAGRTLGPSPSAASGLRTGRAGADTSPKAVAVSRQERRRTPAGSDRGRPPPVPGPSHGPARHPMRAGKPADSGGSTLAIGWHSWPYASALERRATRETAPPSRGRSKPARAAVSMPRGACRVRLAARGWPAGRLDGPSPDRPPANGDPRDRWRHHDTSPSTTNKPHPTTHHQAEQQNRSSPHRRPTPPPPFAPLSRAGFRGDRIDWFPLFMRGLSSPRYCAGSAVRTPTVVDHPAPREVGCR